MTLKLSFFLWNFRMIIYNFGMKKTIAIFNASSNLGSKYEWRVKQTIKLFNDYGINVVLGDLSLNHSNSYTAANAIERAKEFNELVAKYDYVMSMIGGFNSSSILPYIDYELIKKRKTKIIGFSDITAILLAVYQKTKLKTYYGPSFLTNFFEQDEISKYAFKQLNNIFFNEINYPIKQTSPLQWTEERIDWKIESKPFKKMIKQNMYSINPNIIQGRLIGGNLNTMCTLYNTEYFNDINENDILLIEDSYVDANIAERSFSWLKNTKILSKIKGIIIGKIEHYDDLGSNKTYAELFLEFLDRKVPILINYDCSHTLPMNILKIGGNIILDTINLKVTLLD